MAHDARVLIDSDAFVGRLYLKDPHHKQSLQLFQKHETAQSLLITTNMVVAETATVLSHRSGQKLARRFLDILQRSQMAVVHIDEKLHQDTLQLFGEQTKKGTSAVDCANVVVMRGMQIPKILSFDRVYAKQFNLQYA